MNIADLFFGFRGDGARLQADAKTEGAKAGKVGGDSFATSFKKSFTGANIGKGLVQGLGLAGALGAVNLASKAVSSFTDVIGDSVRAAISDEESQNRLRASLKANIPAWDGNTDAIEANISAKQRLAFDDETLRDSLTVLVGATHDVTKAQEIQNTAMDLARFKHIDLRTASEALIKVEAGVYRSLKSLGIVLKDGATQTEALAAVQAVASGQAEAYANTTAGQFEAAQIGVNEAMEDFGRRILPLVATGLKGITGFLSGHEGQLAGIDEGVSKLLTEGTLEQMTVARDAIQKGIKDLKEGWGVNIGPQVNALTDDLARVNAGIQAVTDQGFKPAAGASADMAERVMQSGRIFDKAVVLMSDTAVDFRDKFRDTAGAVIRYADKIRRQMAADAKAIIDGFYGPLELEATRHDQRLQLFADQETLRLAKTKEEQRQARDDIVSDLHDQATTLAELGAAHKLTAVDVQRFAKDARSQYGSMSKDAIADTEAIITKLGELAGLKPKVTIKIDAKGTPAAKAALQLLTHHAAGTGPLEGERASGGPVKAGKAYLVNENTPRSEIFVPKVAGTIYPTLAQVPAMAGAGASGDTIHVNMLDNMPVYSVADIGDRLGMMERRGYLRRGLRGQRSD